LVQGADFIARAGWKGARWLSEHGKPFDIRAALKDAECAGVLDRSIWIGRRKAAPLTLRLVGFRRRPRRRGSRRGVPRSGKVMSSPGARWLPPDGLSSLPPSMQKPSQPAILASFTAPAGAQANVYRERQALTFEMAFKRLKSLIGLSAPPGEDPQVAKTWILAHLLTVLLLEPHTSAPEVSPRMAA